MYIKEYDIPKPYVLPLSIIIRFYLQTVGSNHMSISMVHPLPYNDPKLWFSGTCDGDFFAYEKYTGLIQGLRPANERRRYFVTTSLFGWTQA